MLLMNGCMTPLLVVGKMQLSVEHCSAYSLWMKVDDVDCKKDCRHAYSQGMVVAVDTSYLWLVEEEAERRS